MQDEVRHAESAAELADRDRPGDVRALLRLQLLARQSSLAVINTAVALVFAATASLHAPLELVAGWLGYIVLAQALRLALIRRWRTIHLSAGSAGAGAIIGDASLGRRLTIGSLAAGVGWGAMGWLFIGAEAVLFQVVVAFVLAGMAAGSITALPAHPPAFFAFLLPALLPTALRLLLDQGPHSDVMGLLILGFALGIGHLGLHDFRSQRASAELFLTNEGLVASLRQSEQELERRVVERTRQLQSANEQMAAEIKKRRRSEAQVRHLLHHDPLTSLPNRLVFADRLAIALRRAQREGSKVAVVLFDIDRFKSVNDSHGHLVADALLRALAGRLQSALRASDTLARLGGDEFGAVFPDLEKQADAERLAGKLLELAREPFRIEGRLVAISLSIGVSLFPAHGGEPAALMSGADLALYDAKLAGRDRYSILTAEMLHRSKAERQTERELEGAAARGELRVVYQPQFSLGRKLVVGAEALVRWAHPEKGLLAPAAFIPAAEASGLVREIDSWVLATACRRAAFWQGHGHPVRVAVNLSASAFRQPGLAPQIAAHLATAGLDPRLLEVEITESAYLDRETTSVDVQLQQIKALGVRIAIDDFGTGFASLAYLRWLPLDVIKIDRSFVAGIASSRHDEAIVASTVALATRLEKTVIAEGVETAAQLEILARLGCDEMQGYLFGRPASESSLRRRLAA